MDINEYWLPIIFEGIKWVKEKMTSSKKDIKLKLSDLEQQVKLLSYGNELLMKNIEQIVSIIISKLESDGHYTINADTIIKINENNGQMYVEKEDGINNATINSTDILYAHSIFDHIDEEIMQCRLTRPSEREEKE